jgi:hypothetical protein
VNRAGTLRGLSIPEVNKVLDTVNRKVCVAGHVIDNNCIFLCIISDNTLSSAVPLF